MRSTVTCGKTPTTLTSSGALKSCCHVIVTQSAGKEKDMSELQTHHYMTPEHLTWLLCSVSVISANTSYTARIRLNRLIGTKVLTSGFLEIFCS